MGKWERLQLLAGAQLQRTGMYVAFKEHFQGPFMERASVDTKIMEGVDHRRKLPDQG